MSVSNAQKALQVPLRGLVADGGKEGFAELEGEATTAWPDSERRALLDE
jgi:hypothetical protein